MHTILTHKRVFAAPHSLMRMPGEKQVISASTLVSVPILDYADKAEFSPKLSAYITLGNRISKIAFVLAIIVTVQQPQ